MIKYELPIGYVAYKISSEECFSFGGLSICDDCGTFCSEGGYLVPVLNHFMCSECFFDWLSRAKFYSEDLDFEQYWVRYYERILSVVPGSLVIPT